MDASLERALTRLDKDALVRIDDGRGRTVAVFQGRVWITQDGDPRDVILRAGESFTFDRDGTALVQALVDSGVLIEPRGRASDASGSPSGRASDAFDTPNARAAGPLDARPIEAARTERPARLNPARLFAAIAALAVVSGASQVWLTPPALAAASASLGLVSHAVAAIAKIPPAAPAA